MEVNLERRRAQSVIDCGSWRGVTTVTPRCREGVPHLSGRRFVWNGGLQVCNILPVPLLIGRKMRNRVRTTTNADAFGIYTPPPTSSIVEPQSFRKAVGRHYRSSLAGH